MIEFRNARKAADAILVDLPNDIRVDHPDDVYAINARYTEPLADYLQLVIAIVLSSIIDAGSEREVVIEDEDLSTAITNAIKEWSYNA